MSNNEFFELTEQQLDNVVGGYKEAGVVCVVFPQMNYKQAPYAETPSASDVVCKQTSMTTTKNKAGVVNVVCKQYPMTAAY